MKIKTLIEELQAFDPELRVVIDGYEGGVDDILSPKLCLVQLNTNTEHWWKGDHDVVTARDSETQKAVNAVWLRGSK